MLSERQHGEWRKGGRTFTLSLVNLGLQSSVLAAQCALDPVVCIQRELNLDALVKDKVVAVLDHLPVHRTRRELRLGNLLRVPLLEIGDELLRLEAAAPALLRVRVARVEEVLLLLRVDLALLRDVVYTASASSVVQQ